MSRYRAIAPHAGHACIHAFVLSRPASSLHAMSRLQRYADAFAIAPHAVQDVTLAPMPASMPSRSPLAMRLRDACIHAFVRSRPASSLHAMSRLQRYADAFAIAPCLRVQPQDRCLRHRLRDACIHAFVRSRPASSLHAMSRLQRYADAFAIAPHAVQDVALAPMPASMPSRSPRSRCAMSRYRAPDAQLMRSCLQGPGRAPHDHPDAVPGLRHRLRCSPQFLAVQDVALAPMPASMPSRSPLAMRHVTLPRP